MKAMNPLCPCRKVGAWRTKEAAKRRLEQIQADPNPLTLYSPVGLVRCPHGMWHLTSKSGKQYRKGKGKNDRNRRRNR